MRTVTTALNTELWRTDGPSFRWLVSITPRAGSPRYLCADQQTVSGTAYAGELLGVSPMYESIDGVADLTLEVADNPINRAAVSLAAEVVISLWPVGGLAIDASVLFNGEISDPLSIHAGKITADAVSFANLGNRMVGTPLSLAEYPGADPDAVGEIMPVIYGTVEAAPCLAIDSGSITTLVNPVVAGDLLLTVTDATAFPASGTLQIDDIQMAYSARTATDFTTTAATKAHNKGAQVAEIQTQYDYLIADHPVRAVSNVYVDGVRQLGQDFTIVLDDPGDHRAKLRFTTLPTIIRQVNLVADASSMSYTTDVGLVDGIEVVDPTGVTADFVVTEPGHNHVSSSSGSVTASFTSASVTSGFCSGLVYLNDGNWNSFCENSYESFQLLLSHTLSSTPGSPISMQVTVKAMARFIIDQFGNTVANTGSLSVGGWGVGGGIFYGTSFNSGNNYTVTRTLNIGSYATISDMVVSATGGWRIYGIQVNSVTWGSNAGVSVGMAGVTMSGGVSRTGGIVTKGGTGITTAPVTSASGNPVLTGNSVADTKIGGLVTVDVEGYGDDSSGSLTGMPGALIERPDLVARHLLVTYGGVLPARAAAGDFTNYGGDRLAIHLRGHIALRSLIADLARQTAAIIAYSSGRWIMRQRPIPATAPLTTLTDAEVLCLESGASSIVETTTGLRQLKNRHRWRCGKKPIGDGWLAAGVIDSAASQLLYGTREEMVDLDYVPATAQAIALVSWLAARESNPQRQIITLQLLLSSYSLEVGDVVAINSSKTGVTLISGDIINIGPRPLSAKGNGSMTITIEEA